MGVARGMSTSLPLMEFVTWLCPCLIPEEACGKVFLRVTAFETNRVSELPSEVQVAVLSSGLLLEYFRVSCQRSFQYISFSISQSMSPLIQSTPFSYQFSDVFHRNKSVPWTKGKGVLDPSHQKPYTTMTEDPKRPQNPTSIGLLLRYVSGQDKLLQFVGYLFCVIGGSTMVRKFLQFLEVTRQ